MQLNFKKDEDSQIIEELWISLAKISSNIVNDNTHLNYEGEYPIKIRKIQLTSIKALVNAIEQTHNIRE